jgi:hypothetical protein
MATSNLNYFQKMAATFKDHQANAADAVEEEEGDNKIYLSWGTSTGVFKIHNAPVTSPSGEAIVVEKLEFSKLFVNVCHATPILKQFTVTLPSATADSEKDYVKTITMTLKAFWAVNPATGRKMYEDIKQLQHQVLPKNALKRTAIVKYVLGITIPSASYTDDDGEMVVVKNVVIPKVYFTIKGGEKFETQYKKTIDSYTKAQRALSAKVKSEYQVDLPYYAATFLLKKGNSYQVEYRGQGGKTEKSTFHHMSFDLVEQEPNAELQEALFEKIDYTYTDNEGVEQTINIEAARAANHEQKQYIQSLIETDTVISEVKSLYNISGDSTLQHIGSDTHHDNSVSTITDADRQELENL